MAFLDGYNSAREACSCRWWLVVVLSASVLFVALLRSNAHHDEKQINGGLREAVKRSLQTRESSIEYSVLLHLALEHVDDTLVSELDDDNSSAVKHLCAAVNEQANGNQVQRVAEDNGITIGTEILWTIYNPNYQCRIVDAGKLEWSNDDETEANGLYPFRITVEQVVYVIANRTLPLQEVTTMVECGFNRGKGGRVRFRSLLQSNSMFATIENVEVLDGPLTLNPTTYPTPSPTTEFPSSRPSPVPSPMPSMEPTGLGTPATSIESTILTARPSFIVPSPTEFPSTNGEPPVFPVVSRNEEEIQDGGDIDALTSAAIAAGCLMILIACACIVRFRRRSRKKENKGTDKKALHSSSRQSRKRRPSKNRDSAAKQHVPDMVQLDDDNRSWANTTLGDQTAGGGVRRQPLAKTKPAEEGGVRVTDSFDDTSLFTSHLAAPSGIVATDTSKAETFKGLSSSDSHSMLPPSIMPFEEESLMFPIDDLNSTYADSESGAAQSSLLSESLASSSVPNSDKYQGPVDVDQVGDPFGEDPFSGKEYRGAVVERRKISDTTKGKATSEAMDDDSSIRASAFTPFIGAKGSLLNLNLDKEKQRGSSSSFRSFEDDVAPSGASSTSSLTKKMENLFFFGFHAPPEEKSRENAEEEEEKKEVECETRDDERADAREQTQLPLDLLADHQLLERSVSPSSWSSWKVSQDGSAQSKPQKQTSSAMEDEVKSASTTDGLEEPANMMPYGSQFLSAGAWTPAFQRFIPIEREKKEATPNTSEKPSGGSKEEALSPPEKDMLTPASSGLSSTPEDGTGILGVQPRQGPAALANRSYLEETAGILGVQPREEAATSANRLDPDEATGILGVQPRDEEGTSDNRSASSGSTGLSNPWLFDAIEQTLGPRSATADMESLSGRSDRSGTSHQTHKSHKSNRSYNVPSSSKYRGRGEGRIRSAAASVASYAGSSFGQKSTSTTIPPRNLGNELNFKLNRLERQLAALQTETDQVTASSITLSSIGGKSRSTRSSKLTHTGAKLIRKRRVIVEVPPGKLGVVLANKHDGRGTVVNEVRPDSSLKGMLSPGDKLVAIDGDDVSNLSVLEITQIMASKHNLERLLTVITTTHQETKSVTTL